MNRRKLILLSIAVMASIAPAMAQIPADAKLCQFYHYEKSVTAQCVEDGDTTYEENTVNLMWPVQLNGRDCSSLQQELINLITGKDDIHQLDHAINYYLYTNTEGLPIDVETSCKFLDGFNADPSSFDVSRINSSSILIDLKNLSERFATIHIFNHIYFAGAAHGMYSDSYVTYDINLEKVVTIDDVVYNLEEILPAILESLMMTHENDELYLTNGLPPLPSTFYFEDGILHVVYQPYEISGFALGVIDVPVYSFLLGDEVNPSCFTPYGLELMKGTTIQ